MTQETMIAFAIIGSLLLAATAITISLSWKCFLRRLHLIASETAAGQNQTHHVRYTHPPTNSFYR